MGVDAGAKDWQRYLFLQLCVSSLPKYIVIRYINQHHLLCGDGDGFDLRARKKQKANYVKRRSDGLAKGFLCFVVFVAMT